MRTLVIGSHGNIGKPLSRYLESVGHELYRVDIEQGWENGYQVADINQAVDLLDGFETRPDVVYLLAAMVSRVTCEASPGLAIQTNLVGLNNVIQLCKRYHSRLVFFSTSEVYGPHTGELDEYGTPPEPNNRYGLSKWLGEQLVKYEVRNYGLQAVILRPFMIYDEHETQGDHRSFMIRCAMRLAMGKAVDVHQGSSRSWLHVDDAVYAIEKAGLLNKPDTINIGHPDLIDTGELALMIARNLGAPPALLNFIQQPDRMTLVKRPALYRQRDLLDFTPRISIEEGVTRVCDFVRGRYA